MKYLTIPKAQQEKLLIGRKELISSLRSAQNEIMNLQRQVDNSKTDSLTGLWRVDAGKDFLYETIREAARENRDLAVLYIDLDNFHYIDNTIGHIEADKILNKFGSILLSEVRPGDIAVRYGGDEFFVIVKSEVRGRGGVAANALWSRLKSRIGEATEGVANGEIRLGASSGVSSFFKDVPVELAEQAQRIRTKEGIEDWAEEVGMLMLETADLNMLVHKTASKANRDSNGA